MARNSNRTQVTIKPEDVVAVAADPIVLHIYSGNIMRIKPETGYILMMVRNVDGSPMQEEAMALFLEQDAEQIETLKLKVGDNVAFVAEGYAETDMELPRDKKPIRKPYGYKPGSLAVVRRKLHKVAPTLLEGDEADKAKPSTGITTRLAELAKNLGAFFGGTSK